MYVDSDGRQIIQSTLRFIEGYAPAPKDVLEGFVACEPISPYLYDAFPGGLIMSDAYDDYEAAHEVAHAYLKEKKGNRKVAKKKSKVEEVEVEAAVEETVEDEVVRGDIDEDEIPFIIVKPSDRLVEINALIYGKSGVGKSVLSGSVAHVEEMKPALFIDVEGGVLSLHANECDDIDITRIRHFTEIGVIHDYLQSPKCKYKTVILDSVTELQKYCMEYILDEEGRSEPVIKDWGTNATYMRKVIRWFRDLPLHFIATCLESIDKDERTGAVSVIPSLPGKLAWELPAYFDIAGRLTSDVDAEGEPYRELHLNSTSTYVAKDRTNSLDGTILNPNMSDMFTTIQSMRRNND